MRTQNKGAGHNTSKFIALKHTYNKIQQHKPGTAQSYYGTNYRLYLQKEKGKNKKFCTLKLA